jgi:Type ISP C-terminal specificity domain
MMGIIKRATAAQGPIDLRVTAPWGYAARDGVIMPGGGRVEPETEWPERAELGAALRALAPSAADPLRLLGAPIRVFLNDETYWASVSNAVWEYRIGGYQIVKKWLSYRQHDLLGRALTVEEARHVTNMIRRISVIVLLTEELNENYVHAGIARSRSDYGERVMGRFPPTLLSRMRAAQAELGASGIISKSLWEDRSVVLLA